MLLRLPIIIIIAIIFTGPTQILGLTADYEGDSHPKEPFREARGEMCLQENSTFCFRPFEVGAGFSKTREQQQKWPEQGPEGVESNLFWLC